MKFMDSDTTDIANPIYSVEDEDSSLGSIENRINCLQSNLLCKVKILSLLFKYIFIHALSDELNIF